MNESIIHEQNDRLLQYQVRCYSLPLAVYREVAAHLRQVTGVTVTLLPQLSEQFDYTQSQIGGMQICYAESANAASRQRVRQILDYYGDRYGTWEEF